MARCLHGGRPNISSCAAELMERKLIAMVGTTITLENSALSSNPCEYHQSSNPDCHFVSVHCIWKNLSSQTQLLSYSVIIINLEHIRNSQSPDIQVSLITKGDSLHAKVDCCDLWFSLPNSTEVLQSSSNTCGGYLFGHCMYGVQEGWSDIAANNLPHHTRYPSLLTGSSWFRTSIRMSGCKPQLTHVYMYIWIVYIWKC